MSTREPAPFGWETWTWDETLFQGTASYYRQGRDPYAPQLSKTLAAHLGLDGRGHLLDVGCGPGTVALLLADQFETVTGLDPDADMIAEARIAARESAVGNASWVLMRAEELPGSLGGFRVVSFAQSFHWMDRPRVAAATRQMLEPGGAAVQIDPSDGNPDTTPLDDTHPPVPDAAIDELRIRWLGPNRRAGQGRRDTSPDGEDRVFQAAGFAPEEIVVVPDGRVIHRTLDQVVARVLSNSWAAPHLFGTRLPEFELDLRAVLHDASPEGLFSVGLPANRLRIRRPR
ncbi:MAG TPA: class I SAM-dependent methyltransferase [Acidimicrobiales bacterium]